MKKSNLAFILVLFILAFACSNNNQFEAHNTDGKDSIHNHIVDIDSSSIAIFSEDYKLIKEVKYIKSEDWMIYESYIKGYPKSDTLIGDFNGDGKKETACFQRSETVQYYIDNRECIGSFVFSNSKIKSLKLGDCCGGTFKNEGDLDDNGTDEIGVMCSLPTGACRYYYIYTYKDNEWIFFLSAIESSLSMRESGIVLIEKDTENKGYVIIRNMLYFNNDSMPQKYRNQGGGSCSWSNVVEYRIQMLNN